MSQPSQSSPSSSSSPPSSSTYIAQPPGTLHMDTAILSISHSPLSVMDATACQPSIPIDTNGQRKITLLTRPQPQPASNPTVIAASAGVTGSVASVGNTPGPTLIAANPLSSDIQGARVPSLQHTFLPTPTPIPGRATRDDYYDTEDPSVNLHEFIINSMQAQKNRIILLKLEEMFYNYVSDHTHTEPLKLPPWDSYHRMLAHRVAAYFGLEHNVDPMDKSCVIVCKGRNTRIPRHRFGDYIPQEEVETAEPKLILKRNPREASTIEKVFEPPLPSTSAAEVKTFEEREVEYEKARARIFNQQQQQQQQQQPTSQSHSSRSSISFEIGSRSSTGNSIFPSMMHHRRTASDTATALFNRPSAELKKEGPSSSHSSRSATPLIASFLRTQEAPPPPSSAPAIQMSPQQQPSKQQAQQSQSQSQQHQPTQSSQPQLQHQTSPQLSQQLTKYPPRPRQTMASLQFQPVQSMPVLYPQPAVIPDWYYQQQMMMYQLSPQQFVPAQYTQMVQPGPVFPVNQPYSVNPGAIGQPNIVSPIARQPPSMRLPIVSPPGAVVEQVASPPHPTGVTLVRPVPQQASPVRPKMDPTLWTPPHLVGQQPGLGPQPSPSQLSGHTAFTTFVPVMHDSAQHQLAEQMEKSLSFVGGGGNNHQPDEEDALMQLPEKQNQKGAGQKQVQQQQTPVAKPPRSGHSGELVNAPNGSHQAPFSYPMAVHGGLPPEHFGGHVVSPTQGPVQLIPPQMQHPMLSPSQEVPIGANQPLPPNQPHPTLLQYPSSMPPHQAQNANQPTTPPIGLNLHPPSLLQAQAQHQGIFSPPSTTMTHSPVQILGHTLGTSLFSPPPSTSTQHGGMFVNSPTTSGKIVGYAPGTPAHPPVGSGTRFRRYNSPKQSGGHISEVSNSVQSQPSGPLSLNHNSPVMQHKHFGKLGANGANPIPGSSGFQTIQLPPRLAQQQQQQQNHQRNSGTRYQNQRHPANRGGGGGAGGGGDGNKGGGGGVMTLADHMPTPFVPMGGAVSVAKREPLLPTPPSTHMVKLDTTLTCGVPLNVMEVVNLPPEGSAERQQAFQILQELGAQEFKGGRMPKSGEDVVVAVFNTPESAVKALHLNHPHYALSIPRNNHAKFILTLLQAIPVAQ